MTQRRLKMVKRLFSLNEVAFKWLKREAIANGISTSEFLRRIVDEKREQCK